MRALVGVFAREEGADGDGDWKGRWFPVCVCEGVLSHSISIGDRSCGRAFARALEVAANVLTAAWDAAAALMLDRYPLLLIAGVTLAFLVTRRAGDVCRFMDQSFWLVPCPSHILVSHSIDASQCGIDSL